ncbi:MAG: hypothetical protein M1831_006763 [Alyxoria varia]|nr:MAG: hypothetical protein M1831_006763 [Alyxoria varia]
MATTASQKPASNAPATPTEGHGSRKGKSKKATDPAATEKQIAETIASLERSKAGEKDEAIEIEREVKKANREMSNLLSTIEQPMSRLDVVQKRYSELFAEMKRMEREIAKSKKRGDQLQKEKDASRSELSKLNTVKDKLEKLCRELQKENKKLKDDNRRLGETETRMRNELHERLEGMVSDVKYFMDQVERPENVSANADSDELFRQKYKSFIEQYELRELQFHSLLRTKEIEVQYQSARFEQQKKAQEQEAGRCRQLTAQVSTFSHTENELRNQLNVYVEKFKQVEDTLNNSNELFLTFRREMEGMSKKTKRLEQENSTLTRKSDLHSGKIFTMAEEREHYEREINTLKKRNDNLEKLCRGMQAQGRADSVSNGGEKGATTVTNGTRRGKAKRQGRELPHVCRHPHHHHHHPAHPSRSNLTATTQSAEGHNVIHDEGEGTESDYESRDSADAEDEDEDEDPCSRSRSRSDEDQNDENHKTREVDEATAAGGYDPWDYHPERPSMGQENAEWEHGDRDDGGDDTEDDSLILQERLPSPHAELKGEEEAQQLHRHQQQPQQLQQQEQAAQQKQNQKPPQSQSQATAGARDSSASNSNSKLSWLGSIGRKNSSTNSDKQSEAQQSSAGSSSIPPPKTVNRFAAKSPGSGVVHGVRS